MSSAFNLKASQHIGTAEGKRYFNEQHFTESAPRYDLATRMLSFGQDRSWKRKLLKILPPQKSPRCVDIACGTGDISFSLAQKYPDGSILGVDLTQAMVDIAEKKNSYENLTFAAADMCSLPLESSSVDILTGSYAIRNAPSLADALEEFNRVLAPGGLAAFLDFSKSRSRAMQLVQSGLLGFWGRFCGLVLHGNSEVHGYIAESLRSYPNVDELGDYFRQAGFKIVRREKLLFGMLELTLLEKLKTK